MDTAINKDNAIAIMADNEKSAESRAAGANLVALIEIREAIEEGFARLDQTHIEGAMMLVGVKESLDGYVESRLKTDKVMAGMAAAMMAKAGENGEKPDGPVDEPKKPAVTLNVGDFGGPHSDSGVA